MKINEISLPHPILGNGVDVKGKHSVSIDLKRQNGKIIIEAQHTLINKSLQRMIKSGKAAFCIHASCAKTFFRETSVSCEDKQFFEVAQDRLRDKVNVDFFVTAQRRIDNYKLDGFNPDYDDAVFQVEKGDVLSYGGSFSFIADKQWMSSQGISSFIAIKASSSVKSGMDISLEEEKILIMLSPEEYKRYQESHRQANFEALFHSCIALPALIYAFARMFSEGGEASFKDCLWYQCLDERLKNDDKLKNVPREVDAAAEMAQIILDDPLSRTLTAIDGLRAEFDSEE